MDATERTRLRALCESTELPWRGVDVTDGGTVLGHGTAILRPHSRWLVRRVAEVDMGDGAEHDTAHAALIVGAVNALPTLLDALDAAEALRPRDPHRTGHRCACCGREGAPEADTLCPWCREGQAAERERDDARAEVETLRAEAALLREIAEGRTRPPGQAMITAMLNAGLRLARRWHAVDADGRPCAWPTVTP